MADEKQESYYSNQPFSIDIDKIYNDFIKEIDEIRSYTNTNNPNNTKNLFASLKEENKSISNNSTAEVTLQESRCHAFFRLIGFPVASKDYSSNKIYNPGFDAVKSKTKVLKLNDKINIAQAPISGFEKLSLERELYPSKLKTIFSNSNSIDAATLALSSGTCGHQKINLRSFVAPLENSDPFDMTIQSYTIELNSYVGKTEVSLLEYQTPNGDTPKKLQKTRKHIIKPFIVDPKIELSVTPCHRRVAVPFVPDKNHTKISPEVFVKRPLIEKVIRDRFAISSQEQKLGNASKELVDFIKKISAIKDEELVNKISNSDYFDLNDKAKFVYFLNIIQEMMVKLIGSINIINKVQSLHYWVPLPSDIGPEGGCEVRNIFIPTLFSDKLLAAFPLADKNILMKQIQVGLTDTNVQASTLNGIPDVGGFAFNDFFPNTFTSETSEAQGNNSKDTLNRLVTIRNKNLKQANDALRAIEIIMGEFSGLGLCDIIAILAALYIMPKEQLIGFLDEDAKTRLFEIREFAYIKEISLGSNYTEAMTTFTSTVKDFYNLMDKIYKDYLKNNGSAT